MRLIMNIIFVSLVFLPITVKGAEVEISHDDVSVAGFPIPVKVTVKGEATIVEGSILTASNPFVISLRGDKGNLTFPKRETSIVLGNYMTNPPRPDIELPLPKVTVPLNKKKEYILDLSILPCFNNENKRHMKGWQIPPGKYRIEFNSPDFTFHNEKQYVEIVKPNSDEERILKEIDKSIGWRKGTVGRSRPERWSKFIKFYNTFSAKVDFKKMTKSANRQMGYYLLIAEMGNLDKDLSELSLSLEDIKRYNPLFETDLLVLKYEIEVAKDSNKAEIDRLYDKIKSKRPSFRRLTKDNLKTLSIIEHFRKYRHKRSKQKKVN